MKSFSLLLQRPFWLSSIIAPLFLFTCSTLIAGLDQDADVKADKAERNSRKTKERTDMTREATKKSVSTSATPIPSATPAVNAKLKKQLQAEKAEAVRKGDKIQAKKIQDRIDRLR
jgi:hypothetical protein